MLMPHIGPMELGLIVLLVLIIFGVGKLPQVGGALGRGVRAFREGKLGEDEDAEAESTKKPRKPRAPKQVK